MQGLVTAYSTRALVLILVLDGKVRTLALARAMAMACRTLECTVALAGAPRSGFQDSNQVPVCRCRWDCTWCWS